MRYLIVFMLALMIACSYPPDARSADVTWAVIPPSTTDSGQPVPPEFTVRLLVEYRENGGDAVPLPTASTRDTVTVGEESVVRMLVRINNLNAVNEHQIRVAPVGANGLTGIWSEWSDPCIPMQSIEGAPGLATVPAVISVVLVR